MFKNILVPVDGSELSDSAVARACVFAGEASARLTFYHAKPAYFPGSMAGEPLFDDAAYYESYRHVTQLRAEAILARAAARAAAAGVACVTFSDDIETVHEGIIAAARSRSCDLIFMASHGRRGASALLLGSETQKVLTHCTIPVLVYRQA